MATSRGYELDPTGMAKALADQAALLKQLSVALDGLRNLAVPTAAYGVLGSPVASASASLHDQTASTVSGLHGTLTELNTRLGGGRRDYTQADTDLAGAVRAVARKRPTTWR